MLQNIDLTRYFVPDAVRGYCMYDVPSRGAGCGVLTATSLTERFGQSRSISYYFRLSVTSCPARVSTILQGVKASFRKASTSSTVLTSRSSMVRMISPVFSPKRLAPEPTRASRTTIPESPLSSPRSSASAGDRLATLAPRSGLVLGA